MEKKLRGNDDQGKETASESVSALICASIVPSYVYASLGGLTTRRCTPSARCSLSSFPRSSTVATSPMSQTPSTAEASSRFQAIFNAALKSYQKQTKKDLLAHPLASQLQTCDSTSAVLVVLQDQVRQFDEACSGDERLTKWLNPTVNVLYAFSATLGEGVGLVSHNTLANVRLEASL